MRFLMRWASILATRKQWSYAPANDSTSYNKLNNNINILTGWAISLRLLLRPQYPMHSSTHTIMQFQSIEIVRWLQYRLSSLLFPSWLQGGAEEKTPNGIWVEWCPLLTA